HFGSRATLTRSYGGHGLGFLRQVVRWIAEAEHLCVRKAPDQRERGPRDWVLGKDFCAHRRVLHRPEARGERFRRDRFVGWRSREGVLAPLQPKQDTDSPWGKHGADRHAGVDGIAGKPEQLLPNARALLFVALCQREDRGSA